MAQDPLILVHQAEPVIEVQSPSAERPAPSPEQQRLADDVFSRDQAQMAATLLGVQAGLAFVQHLVAETFPPKPAVEHPPRRKPEDSSDE